MLWFGGTIYVESTRGSDLYLIRRSGARLSVEHNAPLFDFMPEIELTQGFITFVSEAGYEKVKDFKWCAHKMRRRIYATRYGPRANSKSGPLIYMHRVLLDAPKGMQVDHINGNGLDNREENLRVVSNAQNQQAFQRKRRGCASIFRGVTWHKCLKKWMAKIEYRSRTVYLGVFEFEQDAARAYNEAAKNFFGAFASPNRV